MLGIGPRSIVSRPPLWLLLSGSAAAQEVVLNGAQTLLDGETDGLAFDFTDQSAYIVDTGTPANDYDSTGIVAGGELVGPSGKLTYTSPSNKLTMQSDGYIKYQAHNLVLQSEDFSTTWTAVQMLAFGSGSTVNATTAPDGTTTADLLTPNTTNATHYMAASAVTLASQVGHHSVYVKPNGYTKIGLKEGATTGEYATFNLSGSGSVIANTSDDASISYDSSNGWYRVTMTVATASSQQMRIFILGPGYTTGDPNSVGAFAGDGASGVYLWGAHVRNNNAATDYIKTTTAAKYALPLEYDTSGTCLGLLVEEARTNLVTYSTQFDNAAWTKTNTTVSANTATAPNGLTHADSLLENAAAAVQHRTTQSVTTTAQAYTFSVYAKANTRNWIFLYVNAATAGGFFNLSTGAVGSVSGSATTSIQNVGNGWYRCVMTATATATTDNVVVGLSDGDGNFSYNGDGASGVYIWGCQLEAGSFPTSPVVTFGSSSTRAADNISVATSAFPYSATAGTMYAYWQPRTVSGTHHVLSLSDGSVNESILVRNIDTNPNFTVLDGLVSQADLDPGTASTAAQKISAAYEANNFGACYDGGTVVTDVSGTLPTVTTLGVGRSVNASGELADGHIKAISYVPRRKDDIELAVETGYSLPTGYASYGAWGLFGDESSALAFDFTDQSVVNTKTPLVSQGIVSDGALVGPGAALTYTSPSNKLCRQSDGYYKYGAHNLASYSEDAGNATAWASSVAGTGTVDTVTANYAAAWDGQVTAARVVLNLNGGTASGDQALRRNTITLTAGASYVCDIWLKSTDGSSSYTAQIINADGTATNVSITGTWTKFTTGAVTSSSGGNLNFGVRLRGAQTPTHSDVADILVSGFHVYRYPANTDYIKTTSAAKYALPIEYDTSGNCEGLLVEEQRTNIALYSNDANQWSGNGATSALNAVGVTGVANSFSTVTATAGNTPHLRQRNMTWTAAVYAVSAYVKYTNYAYVQINTWDGTTSRYCNFDIQNGTVGTASNCTGSIVDVGNGFYRIALVTSAAQAATTNNSSIAFVTGTSSAANETWNAAGTETFVLGQFQAEAGSFPTSPIITYGAAATRAVDNISIATSAFPVGSSVGSLYAYFDLPTSNIESNSNRIFNLHGTSASTNRIVDAFANSTSSVRVYGSADVTALDASTLVDGLNKVAVAYAVNDYASCVNNGTVAADTTATAAPAHTPVTLEVAAYNAGANALNGRLKALSYVPRRKSDAELKTETT